MRFIQAAVFVALCITLCGCNSPRRDGPGSGGDAGQASTTLRVWPTHQDTATRVHYHVHDSALEVNWTCFDDFISTPIGGRDRDLYKGDVVELFIDPAGDGERIIEIQVNPNNDVLDLLLHYSPGRNLTAGGRLTEASVSAHFRSDRTFNLDGLQTTAHVTSEGYSVTLRIPLAALHQAAGLEALDHAAMRWNLVRLDHRRDGRVVQSSLVGVDPGCQHISPDRTVAVFDAITRE